jgi:hypothetical protein
MRRKWIEREAALTAENADLRARNDRADLLIASEAQVVVAWGGRSGEAETRTGQRLGVDWSVRPCPR